MKWVENDVPQCKSCTEEDCYNCEYAGLRWRLSRVDELRVRKKMLEKSVERTQRQIRQIDLELSLLKKETDDGE